MSLGRGCAEELADMYKLGRTVVPQHIQGIVARAPYPVVVSQMVRHEANRHIGGEKPHPPRAQTPQDGAAYRIRRMRRTGLPIDRIDVHVESGYP